MGDQIASFFGHYSYTTALIRCRALRLARTLSCPWAVANAAHYSLRTRGTMVREVSGKHSRTGIGKHGHSSAVTWRRTGNRRFDLGTIHGLPTVPKFEAFPASRLSASLASRCRAKASRVPPQVFRSNDRLKGVGRRRGYGRGCSPFQRAAYGVLRFSLGTGS